MKIISYKDIEEANFFQKIDLEKIENIEEIIEKVKINGDCALMEYSKRFNDGDFKNSNDFIVSKQEIDEAYKKIDSELLESLKYAIKNVKEFAFEQFKSIKELEIKKNDSILGHKIIPMEKVLCYCPGGNYPLLSSCYMTVVPAVVAGVKEIYVTSPKISPEVIVSAHLSGATKIYKLGGAQAIAAFAYGSESIKKVDKIVGPGNKFVASAKKTIYGQCDIDFIAGPSEVLIVANDIKDSKIIAADMLAQCEHDKDARAYLITTNKDLALEVQKEAKEFLKTLKTSPIATIAFEKSMCIIVDNIEQAIDLSNKKAPEHLELLIKNPDEVIDEFKNYGSLFIGKYCAEVFGDYCSGTNHVLPTNECAKYTGGLSVFDFIKIQTYQNISKNYCIELSKSASRLAQAEGLYAHKLASDLRRENWNH
ncbi:MAG: histidinol dehydrogenase [Candidatus Gastranaerophilales bacterium]|nr:histidinol dehydrogenase [Candidatus Gastranaerophilales bacterium]